MKNKNLPLLLVDDLSSESSLDSRSRAIRFIAGKLAQKLDASIDLICVENLLYYPQGQSPFKRLTDAYLREQKSKIFEIAKSFAVPTRGSLINGEPAKEIIALAAKLNKYEMIILGTSGRTGVRRIFLGSVAEEVIRNTRIPVMTVGPKAQTRMAKFFVGPKFSILIPTSLTDNSLRAEAYGVEIAKRLGAQVIFFHSMREALPAMLQVAFMNPHSVSALQQYIEDNKDLLQKQLDQKCKKALKLGVIASGVLDPETLSASESIVKEIVRSKISLVVMGTHGHSFYSRFFFGRTLRDVVLRAEVPVISLHSKLR